MILLTNDGELAHRLNHPSFEIPKTYLATVNGSVPRGLGRSCGPESTWTMGRRGRRFRRGRHDPRQDDGAGDAARRPQTDRPANVERGRFPGPGSSAPTSGRSRSATSVQEASGSCAARRSGSCTRRWGCERGRRGRWTDRRVPENLRCQRIGAFAGGALSGHRCDVPNGHVGGIAGRNRRPTNRKSLERWQMSTVDRI